MSGFTVRQLQAIGGKFLDENENEIRDRKIREQHLIDHPYPFSDNPSNSMILACIERLELTVVALAHRPASYTFDISRDYRGKITSVTANKVFQSH